jgi:putative flippase GtrA
LGQRHFSGGTVPRRSKWGNTATRWMFRLATGRLIQDTQTGLRGYPANLLPWLQTVPGERYEYELNILLHAADAGLIIENLSISTIYLEENKSSHFRPLIDSARIYGPLVKFAASSLTAFTIDTVTLLLLNALTGSLLLAVVGARVLSSAVNFAVNRRVVFERGREGRTTAAAAQYFVLVIGLLGVNYTALLASQAAGLPLLPAKLVTELVLFGISFAVQQRVIFRSSRSGSASAGPDIHVPGLHETVGELEKSTG